MESRIHKHQGKKKIVLRDFGRSLLHISKGRVKKEYHRYEKKGENGKRFSTSLYIVGMKRGGIATRG